jgi:hypothetical protein
VNLWVKSVRINFVQIKKIILLKKSQNLNIKSELAFSIWSYQLKIMTKEIYIEKDQTLNLWVEKEDSNCITFWKKLLCKKGS